MSLEISQIAVTVFPSKPHHIQSWKASGRQWLKSNTLAGAYALWQYSAWDRAPSETPIRTQPSCSPHQGTAMLIPVQRLREELSPRSVCPAPKQYCLNLCVSRSPSQNKPHHLLAAPLSIKFPFLCSSYSPPYTLLTSSLQTAIFPYPSTDPNHCQWLARVTPS